MRPPKALGGDSRTNSHVSFGTAEKSARQGFSSLDPRAPDRWEDIASETRRLAFDVSFRDRYPYRNQTLTEYVRVQQSPEAMRSATTVNARLFSRSRLRLCYVVMKCLLGAVPVGSPAVTTVLKPARVAMSDGRVFVDKGSEAAAVPLYGDKPYSNLAQRKPTCSLQNMRWEETFSWRAKT